MGLTLIEWYLLQTVLILQRFTCEHDARNVWNCENDNLNNCIPFKYAITVTFSRWLNIFGKQSVSIYDYDIDQSIAFIIHCIHPLFMNRIVGSFTQQVNNTDEKKSKL